MEGRVSYYQSSLSVIVCKKFGGLATHMGILLPDGNVAHCSPGKGARVASVKEFSNGEATRIIGPVPPQLVAAALARLGQALHEARPYDLVNWNCESFTNWVIYGQAVSPQVGKVLGVVAVSAIAGLCIAAVSRASGDGRR